MHTAFFYGYSLIAPKPDYLVRWDCEFKRYYLYADFDIWTVKISQKLWFTAIFEIQNRSNRLITRKRQKAETLHCIRWKALAILRFFICQSRKSTRKTPEALSPRTLLLLFKTLKVFLAAGFSENQRPWHVTRKWRIAYTLHYIRWKALANLLFFICQTCKTISKHRRY